MTYSLNVKYQTKNKYMYAFVNHVKIVMHLRPPQKKIRKCPCIGYSDICTQLECGKTPKTDGGDNGSQKKREKAHDLGSRTKVREQRVIQHVARVQKILVSHQDTDQIVGNCDHSVNQEVKKWDTKQEKLNSFLNSIHRGGSVRCNYV